MSGFRANSPRMEIGRLRAKIGFMACLAGFLLQPGFGNAQIFDNHFLIETRNLPDARLCASGFTGLSLSGDWSAAISNPAALVLAKRIKFSTGYKTIQSASELQGENLVNPDSYSAKPSFSHFAITFPVPVYRGALVWSLAYVKAADYDFSFGIKQPQDSRDLFFSEQGAESILSFAMATQISQQVAGAFALNLYKGDHSAYYSHVDDGAISSILYKDLEQEYRVLKLSLGGMFKPSKNLHLGIQVVLPAAYEIETRDDFSSLSYEFSIPASLNLSASLKDYFWSISAAFLHRGFSSTSYDLPDNYVEPELSKIKSLSQFSLGGEFAVLNSDFTLRAGGWRRTYPQHIFLWDSVAAPDDPDQRVSVTHRAEELEGCLGVAIGMGYLANESISVDISYHRETYTLKYPSLAAGRVVQDRISQGLVLSLLYNM